MRLCAFLLSGAVAQAAQHGFFGHGEPSAFDLAFFNTRETELWIRAGSESLDPIRIGAILTLSYGRATSNASRKAVVAYENFVEYVNIRRGGVRIGNTRRPIELLVLDDRGEAQRAKDAAVLLAQSGVELFLGPLGDDANMAVAAGLGENTSVMITAGAAHEGTFVGKPHVFGVLPAMFFNATIGLLVSQQPRAQTMVVLRDASGKACDDIGEIASVHSLSLLSIIVLPQPWRGVAGRAAITSSLQKIGSTPDILVACAASGCADLFYALEDLQMAPLAVALAGCVNSTGYMTDLPSLPSAARKAYYNFVVSDWSALYNQAQGGSGMTSADFFDFFEDRYGILADRDLANSWLALNCLTAAILAANSTQPTRVQAALRSLSFQTIAGPVTFDVNGQAERPVFTSQLAGDGKARLLLPPPSLEPVVHPFPPWSTRDCLGPRAEPAANDSSAMGFALSASGGQPDCVPCNTTLWAGGVWSGEPGWLCVDRLCGQGEKQVESGACEDCPPGWYSNSNTSVECTLCPPGTIPEPGQTFCEPCPPGTASLAWGSTSCETCAPGKYAPINGSSTCFSCLAGFHAPNPGSHYCTLCPGGWVASSGGMKKCEECPAGRYGARASPECTACEAGRYQWWPASVGCLECPVGSLCEEPGLTYPLSMESWWIWNTSSGDPSAHHCPQGGACLEGGRCREGHTGYLCSVCVARHTMGRDGCEPCALTAGNARDWLATCCLFATWCTVLVLATALAIATADNRDVAAGLMKLFLNYVATMAVMGNVQRYMFYNLARDKPTLAVSDSRDWRVRFITAQVWFMSLHIDVFSQSGIRCLIQPRLSDDLSSQIHAMSKLQHHEQFREEFDDLRAALEHVHYVTVFHQTLVWSLVTFFAVGTICSVALWLYRRRSRWYHNEYQHCAEFFTAVDLRGWSGAIEEARLHDMDIKTIMHIRSHRVLGIWRSLTLYNRWAEGPRSFLSRFALDAEPLVVMVAFCIYPYALMGIMLPLKCAQPFRDEDVGLRMVESPDVDCSEWGSLHATAFALAVLTGFGLPTFFLLNLKRSTTSRFKYSWGFFTDGYKAHYRWWEIIIFFRKATTVALGSLAIPMGARVVSFFLCSVLFFFLHIMFKPFDMGCNHTLDRMERRHLKSWVMYSGVLLFAHTLGLGEMGLTLFVGISALLCVAYFRFCFHTVRLFLLYVLKQVAESSLRSFYKTQYIAYVERMKKEEKKYHMMRLHESDKFIPVPPPVKMPMHEAIRLESTYYGIGVVRSYQSRLKRKPYVFVDAVRMWITLVGDRGDSCDKVCKQRTHGLEPKLFDEVEGKHTPPSSQACKEFVAILGGAVLDIVAQSVHPVMTMNLLDFIVRCGFCFDGEGHHTSFLVDKKFVMMAYGEGGLVTDDCSVDSDDGYDTGRGPMAFTATYTRDGSHVRLGHTAEAEAQIIAKDVRHMYERGCFLRGYTLETFQLNLDAALMQWEQHLLVKRLDKYEEQATRRNLPRKNPDVDDFKPSHLLSPSPSPDPSDSEDLDEGASSSSVSTRAGSRRQAFSGILPAPQDDGQGGLGAGAPMSSADTEDVQVPAQPGPALVEEEDRMDGFERAAVHWLAMVMRTLQRHQEEHELDFRRRTLCRLREQEQVCGEAPQDDGQEGVGAGAPVSTADIEDVQAPAQPGPAPVEEEDRMDVFERAAVHCLAMVDHREEHQLDLRRHPVCRGTPGGSSGGASRRRSITAMVRTLQRHQEEHELDVRRRTLCRLREQEQVSDEVKAKSTGDKVLRFVFDEPAPPPEAWSYPCNAATAAGAEGENACRAPPSSSSSTRRRRRW